MFFSAWYMSSYLGIVILQVW